MAIVFIGPPGVGKGTYARRISEQLGIPSISAGDLIRDQIRKRSAIGKKVAPIIARGDLIPDETVINLVVQRVSKNDCKKGFILDGFPRTLNQAKKIEGKIKIAGVCWFTAPLRTLIKRITGRRTCLSCHATFNVHSFPPKKTGICDRCKDKIVQRSDETPKAVRERMEIYKKQSLPALHYYQKKRGKLVTKIDASDSVNRIVDASIKTIQKIK